jgi:L-lactate dehydrogenase complex protein LldG
LPETSRNAILRRVRQATRDLSDQPEAVARNYNQVGTGASRLELLNRFVDRLTEYGADITKCKPQNVAAAIAKVVPDGIVVVPIGLDPTWTQLLPSDQVTIDEPSSWLAPTQIDAAACVVTASRCAIADTGTIVLDHGPDQGRRVLTLLPDMHICVVLQDDIVESVPQAIRLLEPVRPLTFVSGPSATSDIELIRVQGVHGPRKLCVVVVQTEIHNQERDQHER